MIKLVFFISYNIYQNVTTGYLLSNFTNFFNLFCNNCHVCGLVIIASTEFQRYRKSSSFEKIFSIQKRKQPGSNQLIPNSTKSWLKPSLQIGPICFSSISKYLDIHRDDDEPALKPPLQHSRQTLRGVYNYVTILPGQINSYPSVGEVRNWISMQMAREWTGRDSLEDTCDGATDKPAVGFLTR